MITELEIVNRCLNSMGESRVNSIETSTNPMVQNARAALQSVILSVQSQGWWFNVEWVELYPQPDGRYRCSADTLELSTEKNCNPRWMTLRGRFVYNVDGGTYHTGTRPLRVRIVRVLPLEDIPYTGQRLIQASTVYKYLSDFDGDELKLKEAEDETGEAYILCNAAHTRAVGANMLHQGGIANARIRTMVPYNTWRP